VNTARLQEISDEYQADVDDHGWHTAVRNLAAALVGREAEVVRLREALKNSESDHSYTSSRLRERREENERLREERDQLVKAARPALDLLAAEGYDTDPPCCAEYENLRAALAGVSE
jgi:hypothetical protein